MKKENKQTENKELFHLFRFQLEDPLYLGTESRRAARNALFCPKLVCGRPGYTMASKCDSNSALVITRGA